MKRRDALRRENSAPTPDPHLLTCVSCGQPLLGDPDDDPAGESRLPICGECNRRRNFDVELVELEELEHER